MSNDSLIRSTFPLQREVIKTPSETDKQAEYEKKALESISGSMVFVERKRLTFDVP